MKIGRRPTPAKKESSTHRHHRALRQLCGLLLDASWPIEHRRVPALHEVDWSSVLALALSYRVLGVLAHSKLPDDAGLPAGVKKILETIAQETQAQADRTSTQILELLTTLNGMGVTPMLLKGSAMRAAQLYPVAAMRELSDIDVLVPADRLADCAGALEALAYEGSQEVWSAHWGHQWPPLTAERWPLMVELHREAIVYPCYRLIPAASLFMRGQEQEFLGKRALIPCPMDMAILAVAHAELSDRDYLFGRVDLRRILDVLMVRKKHPELITDENLKKHFISFSEKVALDYHSRWMNYLDSANPSGSHWLGGLLFKRALWMSAHPRTLGLCVELLRPWLALQRDLSDPVLRRSLVRNAWRMDWWRWRSGQVR